MIFKPSNPFSIVVFFIRLLLEGIFLVTDWIIIRYQTLNLKSKAQKTPVPSR
jgi:hypothetical protein